MAIRRPDERDRLVRMVTASVRDALSAAQSIAGRGADIFSGDEAAVLFSDLSVAIGRFRDNSLAMTTLDNAGVQSMLPAKSDSSP